MKPSSFLTTLWGDTPPGRIALWRLDNKRSMYPPHAAGADFLAGQPDVYTAVALTHEIKVTSRGRPSAKYAVAIAGMWIDIDIDGGPDNKTGAAPDLDAALALAHHHLEPTIIIGSGYGLHAWHLLHEPWEFHSVQDQDDAARLAAGWQHAHRHVAGFTVDSTHDLARLLRLPSTVNAKGGGAAPVDVIEHQGQRYSLDALRDVAALAPPRPTVETSSVDVAAVTIDPGTQIDADVIAALLDDPDIRGTFLHQRGHRGWSLSQYDMSLAGQLARAGWPDQGIAAVLVAHREHHDPGGYKQQRVDYLTRTIQKARQPSEGRRAA